MNSAKAALSYTLYPSCVTVAISTLVPLIFSSITCLRTSNASFCASFKVKFCEEEEKRKNKQK